MFSLSDKLKTLGVKIGAGDLPTRPKEPSYPIEMVMDGHFITTPYGEVFHVRSHYPTSYRQGRTTLQIASSLRIIAAWSGEARFLGIDPQGLVFLDTETSGLAGGTGTFAFLIGVGRLAEDVFHLFQYFMRDPLEEPAQLAALIGFLDDFTGVVSFNGKAFDVPILNARFITNGEISPFTSIPHLDLLPLARRLWRDRLPSRALSYLEEHILAVKRTQEEVPGWLIPQLYFDYLRSGDARPLKGVFYHNSMDILSLAALLNHIAVMLEDGKEEAIDDAIDLIAMAKLFEDLSETESAVQYYAKGLAQQLPDHVWSDAVRRWSYLEKRRGNLDIAISLWQRAFERHEVYACVELAKFFEHRQQDYQIAFQWTQHALDLVNAPEFPRIETHQWLGELEHRKARLLRKLDNRE